MLAFWKWPQWRCCSWCEGWISAQVLGPWDTHTHTPCKCHTRLRRCFQNPSAKSHETSQFFHGSEKCETEHNKSHQCADDMSIFFFPRETRFLTGFVSKSSFRFPEKVRGSYRDFRYALCPYTGSQSPSLSRSPTPEGTSVRTDEPTLTLSPEAQSSLSGCCTFYGFWQMT